MKNSSSKKLKTQALGVLIDPHPSSKMMNAWNNVNSPRRVFKKIFLQKILQM